MVDYKKWDALEVSDEEPEPTRPPETITPQGSNAAHMHGHDHAHGSGQGVEGHQHIHSHQFPMPPLSPDGHIHAYAPHPFPQPSQQQGVGQGHAHSHGVPANMLAHMHQHAHQAPPPRGGGHSHSHVVNVPAMPAANQAVPRPASNPAVTQPEMQRQAGGLGAQRSAAQPVRQNITLNLRPGQSTTIVVGADGTTTVQGHVNVASSEPERANATPIPRPEVKPEPPKQTKAEIKQIEEGKLSLGSQCPVLDVSADHTSVTITWTPLHVEPPADPDAPKPKSVVYEVQLEGKRDTTKTETGTGARANNQKQKVQTRRGPSHADNIVYTGGETSCVIGGLLQGVDYTCRVRATRGEYCGAFTQVTTVSVPASVPDAPTGLRLSARTSSSIAVAWDKPPHDGGRPVLNFRLQVALEDGIWKDEYTGPERKHKIAHKFRPTEACQVRVCAINEVGTSEYTSVLECKTSAAVPSAPTLAVKEAQSTTITLQWTEPESNGSEINEYVLEMQNPKDNYGFRPMGYETKCSHSINNLSPHTCYKFRVAARNAQGQGPFSDVIDGWTAASVPGAPAKIRISGKPRGDGFRVTWDRPHDGGAPITTYSIEVGGRVLTSQTPDCDVRDLLPGTTYTVRVCAANSAGQGEWASKELQTTISPPTAPLAPRVYGQPKPFSITLAWDAPTQTGGSEITSYEVALVDAQTGTQTEVATCPGTVQQTNDKRKRGGPRYDEAQHTCTVGGLEAGQMCIFKVRAKNAAGWGPFSETLQASAGSIPPDAPNMPTVANQNGPIAVTWNVPDCYGQPITEYRLEAVPCNGQGLPQAMWGLVYSGVHPQWIANGLIPATQYMLRVQAVNRMGCSAYSPPAILTTPAGPPAPPCDVRSIEATPYAVTLQWTDGPTHGHPLTMYAIECDPPPIKWGAAIRAVQVSQTTMVGTKRQYVIDGLEPEHTYTVKMCAASTLGPSPYSSPVSVSTKGYPPPAPIVEVSHVSHDTITLQWSMPGQNNDTVGGAKEPGLVYEVEFKPETAGDYKSAYVGLDTTCTIERLQVLTRYSVRVRASNISGPGPFTPPHLISTTLPVPTPALLQLTHTTARLAWHPVHRLMPIVRGADLVLGAVREASSKGPISTDWLCTLVRLAEARAPKCGPVRYEVQWRCKDTGKEGSENVCVDTEFVIKDLQPGNQYDFRVRTLQRQDPSATQTPDPNLPATYKPGPFSKPVTFTAPPLSSALPPARTLPAENTRSHMSGPKVPTTTTTQQFSSILQQKPKSIPKPEVKTIAAQRTQIQEVAKPSTKPVERSVVHTSKQLKQSKKTEQKSVQTAPKEPQKTNAVNEGPTEPIPETIAPVEKEISDSTDSIEEEVDAVGSETIDSEETKGKTERKEEKTSSEDVTDVPPEEPIERGNAGASVQIALIFSKKAGGKKAKKNMKQLPYHMVRQMEAAANAAVTNQMKENDTKKGNSSPDMEGENNEDGAAVAAKSGSGRVGRVVKRVLESDVVFYGMYAMVMCGVVIASIAL